MKPEWIDSDGFPTTEYMNDVAEAVENAGHDVDFAKEDDGKGYLNVNVGDRSLYMIWKAGDGNHEYEPTHPDAKPFWEVRWFDEEGDYEPGSQENYSSSLLDHPTQVAELVTNIIREDKQNA